MADPYLRLAVPGLHGIGCELCRDKPRCGVVAYERDVGEPLILCYSCAAIILAISLGWRPGEWFGRPGV